MLNCVEKGTVPFSTDFVSGMMEACYIVFNGNAVVVNALVQTRREIEFFINELKP